ncbi:MULTISPECIES: GGDEF domain-containing protein [Bacillales]|uniref:GGDEF domain-containing protein n=1 Tax=Brevibacillus aydinogluensis TaxID=927786 RepID=A0AA48M6F1_9BACL|nr:MULTISPECIES: GGDEF domain-containing protein [Bacillales]REK63015.1 MAG: GGDEF domain-containing protein [Brevibacillus sp.]MBR8658269.1 GGDEF domain-containing protein [Brevibacillus sp. NL20B1]NNV01395.1 GGDEF domain-containing protein [Brevibacillus sp. MCWH]UFJ61053.1 GGDEF domain-containing protein [Anoxybacillus sediminis]CAJ1002129.1 GGDEF domain-containing protein [Brevibacillus aydinogluensis]
MDLRWIGLGISCLFSLLWTVVYGLPSHQLTAVLAAVVAVMQAAAGYQMGLYAERLREEASLDSLTGALVNRRFFALLEKEIERARRHDYPVTLLFIDLDNFKIFNDSHGHLAGDELLCRFADILKRSIRAQDAVGRWGGEEFVIMLPHAETPHGVAVGERIQRNVREDLGGVTVSIGIASFPAHASTATELAAKADTLMYEAKKKKDCILVAHH